MDHTPPIIHRQVLLHNVDYGNTVDITAAENKFKRIDCGESSFWMTALRSPEPLHLAAIQVSEEMGFHRKGQPLSNWDGVHFVMKLYEALEGMPADGIDDNLGPKYGRQLKIVDMGNNGNTELAQWMARMWVASAASKSHSDLVLEEGGWIETKASPTLGDGFSGTSYVRGNQQFHKNVKIWGPLRYLFHRCKLKPQARFALVLHESNRPFLFDALNEIWWEKRLRYPNSEGIPEGQEIPPNLALIFTETGAIGRIDPGLRTRLPPKCTFALVRNSDELVKLGFSGEEGRHFFLPEVDSEVNSA